MSLAEWIGSVVSIDCGEVLGTYQGHVSDVDQDSQAISIMKGFRNGIRCVVPRITINAQDIRSLSIIKTKDQVGHERQQSSPRHSPDWMEVNHNTPRKNPKDSTTAKPTPSPARSNGHSQSANGFTPSKHKQHDSGFVPNGYHDNGNQNRTTPNKWDNQPDFRRRTNSDSEQRDRRKATSAPRKIEGSHNGMQRENGSGSNSRGRTPNWQDTFSAPLNSFNDEFDFEKNLELFDKQAVFQEIENSGTVKVVKAGPKQPVNYRHDENILNAAPVVYHQIKVPYTTGTEYVTDCGLVVPGVTNELRQRLLEAAESCGLSIERQLEMIGRSACEMSMQLLGGATRLTPKNAHQQPQVVVLCGPHRQGAMGVNCARQLASHGVAVTLYVPNYLKMEAYLESELQLFELSSGSKTSSAKDLPSSPVEMVINTLDSHDGQSFTELSWYRSVVGWTQQCKAPVLSLDPPVKGGTLDPKWSMGIGMPLALCDKKCGQVYLADMGLPTKVFSKVGIKYLSPFGHKFYIALHPNGENKKPTTT